MAIRNIYVVNEDMYCDKFVRIIPTEFTWYSGFAVSQKQKSIQSLHGEFLKKESKHKVLEISSKSESELGKSLSAFNLTITHKTSNKTYSVECAFQSSKVFENGGPFTDILEKTSREAKKDLRLKNSGKLTHFKFYNTKWELEPKTLFYDWLYINALSKHKELHDQIIEFDSFTDIEFNENKSINCQAYSAALYVSLYKRNILSYALEGIDNYRKLFETSSKSHNDKSETIEQISFI